MRFQELDLKGAFLIEPERFEDARGFFARTFCRREFEANGLETDLGQSNLSYNVRAGTLRGMHYQEAPHGEVKLVRCTRGAIFDVIIDLRPGSPTFAQWASADLNEENRRALYVPEGFAHGFQTLTDRTEVFYQMSGVFVPSSARGVRWDDPAFAIDWPPAESRVIADRDRAYVDFRERP